jgi:hypothetical protein
MNDLGSRYYVSSLETDVMSLNHPFIVDYFSQGKGMALEVAV